MQTKQLLHPELITSINLVFNPCKFNYSAPISEIESVDYGAYIFNLNLIPIRFRVAKITPTKIGQFVTLWKRIGSAPIQPYDLSDIIDLFIIAVSMGDNFGQFIFPKTALCAHGVISKNNQGGKRAIRVYPPWDITVSKQAKQTQSWQLKYFLEIPKDKPIDFARARILYTEFEVK